MSCQPEVAWIIFTFWWVVKGYRLSVVSSSDSYRMREGGTTTKQSAPVIASEAKQSHDQDYFKLTDCFRLAKSITPKMISEQPSQ